MTRIGLIMGWGRVRFLGIALVACLVCAVAALVIAPRAHAAGTIPTGDVMVSVGNGQVQEFHPSGSSATLVQTLDTGHTGDFTTGSAFDSSGNFFVTTFDGQAVTEFDPTGAKIGDFGSGYNSDPESIVFNQAGDVLVGQADGSHNILEFDPNGNLIGTFAPTTGPRGTDWIDLAKDQCTVNYTSEGTSVMQYNICTNTQLPDFATGLPGGACYGHRLLPDGGELVACSSEVVRLDSSGNIVQTYTPPGASELFALNLDPDGTSFWTADLSGGNVYELNIASGAIERQFNPNVPGETVAGLSVKGELTAAQDPQITGSGTSVSATEGSSFSGTVATFSDPDTAAVPSDYTASINWGDGATSTGTISGSGGNFTVTGSHSYAEEGSDTITVTITDTDNSANTATASSKATVSDAALHASGATPSRSGKTVTGTVATFTDSDPAGTVSDYSASINWGDGSTSTGTVGGKFAVSGSHHYASAGKYTVTVTIKDRGGSTAKVTTTVTIPKAVVAAASVSAKLSSVPAACVSAAFTARVQGTRIASVRFTLDGAKKQSTTVHRHRQYSARIRVSPGRHALTVRVTFERGSASRFRTFRRTVTGCTPAPSFTG